MALQFRTMVGLRQAQCMILLLWSTLQFCSSFNLDGRTGSYAKFPSWEPCLNGSFSFEFKTDSPNALLVYLDHGKFKYLELKLVGGSIRVRINLGEGTVIIRAGEKLDDQQWHKVEVRLDNERTILCVDEVPHSRTAIGRVTDFSAGSAQKDFMYFGGLPEEFSNQLLLLALPSVAFEPTFKGSIRNLFVRECGGEPHRPDMIDSSGLVSVDVDLCERGNPCLNGGVCLTTDKGLLCNCAKTEYEGERCDIEKVPSDATFFGAQYLSYNLSNHGDVLDSNQDQVSLDFRTKQPDGLLFYTGNKKDYLNIVLKDGVIILTINLGSGSFEEVVPKERTPRLDDNRWHHVVVRREAREIFIEVDGIHRESGSTTGRYTLLSSRILYVAGSPDTPTLPGVKVRTNFKGCMRKVRYKADSVEMDLTDMARSKNPLLKVNGEVIYDKCQELADSRPITFTTPESYLTISTWDKALDRGSMAFQFQTVEQNGLLMYTTGQSAGNSDFFALELVDGYLHLVLNQGSEIMRVVCRSIPVTDGKPHNVYFEYQNNRGYITVDGQKEVFASLSRVDRFDLEGSLSIGGVNKNVDSSTLPRELWSGVLGKGYVGCLLDMVMDGNKIDLVTAAQIQGVAGVAEYCQVMEPHCISHPCMHQGVCVEGWNRFTCDCRATGFIDSVCQTAAATLQFDGTQFVKVTQPEESQTQAEEISLRFRTMHPNGLLFMTTSDQNADRMELYLENGIIYLAVDVGSGKKILSVGHMLNDDRWHTLYIKRRGHDVKLQIDVLRPVAEKLSGTETSLSIKAFFIGYPSVTKPPPAEVARRAAQFDFRRVDIDHVFQNDNQLSKFDGYIGSMQQFIFNDNLFFEMARTGHIENIQLTARLTSEGYVVADPVTFKSMDAFAVLPRLQAHDKFSVSFQLKTTESSGLLMYNAGKGQDFFAMELTDGFFYYVYNMGGGTQRIRANVNEKLNDNRWHEIRLLRTETYKQLIRVDDNTPTVDDLSGAKAIHFDLQDHLYLGGVKKTMYHTLPKKIEARYGFMGCIGSLDLNGYLPNILREASPVHEAVGDGCQGPTSQCQNDSCANGGRCVQQWNTISCDCDMTSYTGPLCQQESVMYKFGPGAGLISFTHPLNNLPSTTRENLALGFRTKSENAVLVRIDSSSFDDYIELELVRGKVYAFYNMGTRDYPIGEMFEKLNDGKYHIVRFTRSGANSTIQVDNLMMQTKMPRGQQAHTFNNQAYVYVGGRRARNGSIVLPFQGTMAGVVMNGIKILELAKRRDERIQLIGNVSLISSDKESGEKEKKDKDKNDILDMQSTMGIGHNPPVSTSKNHMQQPSAVTYHFRLRLHAMYPTTGTPISNSTASKDYQSPTPAVLQMVPQTVDRVQKRHRSSFRRRRRDFDALKYSTRSSRDSRSKEINRKVRHSRGNRSKNRKTRPIFEEGKATTYLRSPQHVPEELDINPLDREIVKIVDSARTFAPGENALAGDDNDLFSEWSNEIFSDRELFSDVPNQNSLSAWPEDSVKEEVSSNPEPASKDYKCSFSDSSGSLITVKHGVAGESDEDAENDSDGDEFEGSGLVDESPAEELLPSVEFQLLRSNSSSTARLALLSGTDRPNAEDRMAEGTTMSLPFRVHEGYTLPSLHLTVSSDGKLIDWGYMTTALNGVTDDIIYSGAGPECTVSDEEDCKDLGSTDDDIIKSTVILKTTPRPPITTTGEKPSKPKNGLPCKDGQCPKVGLTGFQTDFSLSTPDPSSKEEITIKPTGDTGKTLGAGSGSSLNIGLIVGIAVSVLVAVVILCIALYKFRSRDEGTYKVDESQNFTTLDGKKGQQGNGTLLSHSDTGKRGGKKKDVKEWYV